MKYRSLIGLSKSTAVSDFLNHNKMQLCEIAPYLWIYHDKVAIRVYGLTTEDFLYIDVFNLKNEQCCSASQILVNIPKSISRDIYTNYIDRHTQPFTLLPNPNNVKIALIAESYLFTYLQLLSNYKKESLSNGFLNDVNFKPCLDHDLKSLRELRSNLSQ